ncbi:MAG: rRNA maturation protein [Archaeoglobaceae archaeon]|nr:rRNA maturation protein [Archaeoglobaceae archaeon]MCX8152640.1 rRNA maturation protein [Archaeoglobaceae archaeon]MDW8014078.1 rRNA maturation protein [Archaeoglobaceae archaeon]
MILTTSRKPSRKTRSFAKVLARFTNWLYVNRGKMSLEDIRRLSEDFVIVSEMRANPSALYFYRKGKPFLTIRISVSSVKKVKISNEPAIFIGKAPFEPTLINALPQTSAALKLLRKVDFPKKIIVKDNKLKFYYKNNLIFILKLFSVERLNYKN